MVYGPCGRVASGDSSVTGSLTDKCEIYSIANDTVSLSTTSVPKASGKPR